MIRKTAVAAFQTAWNVHDMDALGGLFTDDATFVNRFFGPLSVKNTSAKSRGARINVRIKHTVPAPLHTCRCSLRSLIHHSRYGFPDSFQRRPFLSKIGWGVEKKYSKSARRL
jgi:hypothetical protein